MPLLLPGSQHFAAAGKIELAYHRIQQPAAELRDTEQQGDGKAEYGVRLLEHLSEDLQYKLGSGFSISNLRNTCRFYLDDRIHQPAGELNWSQHVALLPLVVSRSSLVVLSGYASQDSY